MVVAGRIKRGVYFDSVTLMTVGKEVAAMDGVADAGVVMGTKQNKTILSASDLLAPELEAGRDTDLLIGVRAESAEAAERALDAADGHLERAGAKPEGGDEFRPMSIEGALKVVADANLALISVAGRYAGREAMKALEAGLHVMVFSDNVPLETEVALKKRAKEKGLLVMGPDCGTVIINGVPLGFANIVSRGDIGIVAASGTGLQEVSSIISNEGCGVSQAIGTGGRDIKTGVGGIMFIEALHALAADPATRVIVLVSKPPDEDVLGRVREVVGGIGKPVVSAFLGAEEAFGPRSAAADGGGQAGRWGATTLEEAALMAVALSKGENPDDVTRLIATRDGDMKSHAREEARKIGAGRRYVRALMSGGTFCAEAQIILAGMLSDIYSNAPVGGASRLEDPLKSRMNTVLDLGADEFTIGRPHPMIDYSLRCKRIIEEANDPETAVILLDVVLGYGSNPDPASELSGVVREAGGSILVVCSITGTDRDPQNKRDVQTALADAGAAVMRTNAAASRFAGCVIQTLKEW